MHPIELHLGNFLGIAYPELPSKKLHNVTHHCAHDNASGMFYHIYYSPMFADGFLLLIKTFIRAPPPPTNNVKVCEHNVMQAFPQEQISLYTTAQK